METQQINFQALEVKLDGLEEFMLDLLKQKNPEAYAKFIEEDKKDGKIEKIDSNEEK